jgi:hypothetical protein
MSWHASLPPSWHPVRVSGRECLSSTIADAGCYHKHCDIYSSISIAGSLNEYRIALLKSQSIILSRLTHQPPTFTNIISQAVCQNRIQQLADDICASVPFHLGDQKEPGNSFTQILQYPHIAGQAVQEEHLEKTPLRGAWHLLDPLTDLLRMGIELRAGQKEWVRGQLRRISKIYNLGK